MNSSCSPHAHKQGRAEAGCGRRGGKALAVCPGLRRDDHRCFVIWPVPVPVLGRSVPASSCDLSGCGEMRSYQCTEGRGAATRINADECYQYFLAARKPYHGGLRPWERPPRIKRHVQASWCWRFPGCWTRLMDARQYSSHARAHTITSSVVEKVTISACNSIAIPSQLATRSRGAEELDNQRRRSYQ